MTKRKKRDDTSITRSSSNVFADLELDNPEDLQLKARLTHYIARIIRERGWTQQHAADVLGIKQPDVSGLLRGHKLEHFSVERLMNFLSKLEQKVTITVQDAENESTSQVFVIEAKKGLETALTP